MSPDQLLAALANRLRDLGVDVDSQENSGLWIQEHGYYSDLQKGDFKFIDDPAIQIWCSQSADQVVEVLLRSMPTGHLNDCATSTVSDEPYDPVAGIERLVDLVMKTRGLMLELGKAEGPNLWSDARKFKPETVGYLPTMLDLLWLTPSHMLAYATRCNMRLSIVADPYSDADEQEQARFQFIDEEVAQVVRGAVSFDRLLGYEYDEDVDESAARTLKNEVFPVSEATHYFRARDNGSSLLLGTALWLQDYRVKMCGARFSIFLENAARMGHLTMLKCVHCDHALRESLRLAALRDFHNLKQHSSGISRDADIPLECGEDGFLGPLM